MNNIDIGGAERLISELRIRYRINPLLYDTDKLAADTIENLIQELQKARCVCFVDGQPLNQCHECPR